jgi:hypothetical protein
MVVCIASLCPVFHAEGDGCTASVPSPGPGEGGAHMLVPTTNGVPSGMTAGLFYNTCLPSHPPVGGEGDGGAVSIWCG